MHETSDYSYYKLDGMPCRIARGANGEWFGAQMYEPGQGLVTGPKMTILFDGFPISKDDFNARVLKLIQESKNIRRDML